MDLNTAAYAVGRSVQDDLAHIALRIIDHAAFIVEDHGLAAIRVSRRPGQAWLAGVAGAGEVRPRCDYLSRLRR